ELRGAWFGLAMAALLAVMRWSINFSRFATTGAETVTFTLLTFYFAVRLIRNGRLRDGLWFGVALAAGMYFYRPYLVQLLAVGLYLLLEYPFRQRSTKRTLLLGLTALITALVVVLPLGVFVIDRSEEYFGRLNQVSIFNEQLPDVNDALLQSTLKHVEMFHLSGDLNGRHNLPGAPMLDPVMGSLLVIGLFAALRERRREHLVFLVSMGVALTGGIFSLSFEAPQSLRAIGAITGVVYFAALGLSGVIETALTLAARARPRYFGAAHGFVLVGGAVAVIFMAGWNFDVYFNQQRTNLAVWRAYSIDASLAARVYANYDNETQFYVSPLTAAPLTVQFLAPDALARSNLLDMPDALPLRIVPTSPVTIMLQGSEDYYLDEIQRLYPNGRVLMVRPTDYGIDASPEEKQFPVIELSADEIGSIQGLRDGRGVLYAPLYNAYSFLFAANTRLEIDGGAVQSEAPIQLAQGNHAFAVHPADAPIRWAYSGTAEPEPIPAEYLYHAPVTANGLVASYYANGMWQGTPVMQRIVPQVYLYIQIVPMERPYSVRYQGYLYAPETGEYILSLRAIDTGALIIDGRTLIEVSGAEGRLDAPLTLEQGWHALEVRHQDLSGATRIYLRWKRPGESEVVMISREYLCPTASLCANPAAN
ncbi:MAG: PA14 domain-containing protein, partial [Chloroflexota bacterium]